MNGLVIAGMFAVVAGVIVWTALAAWFDRAAAEQAMARAVGEEVSDERELILAASRKDRILLPFLGGLSGAGRRITPVGFRDKAAAQLKAAGRTSEDDLDRYLAMRTLGMAAVPFTSIAALKFLGPTLAGFAVTGLMAMVLVVLPQSRLTREVAARQKAISKALPDVLDLLVISIEAGLGFEQALEKTISAVPGPLSDEFALMLGEVRAGQTRADALRDLSERVDEEDVRRFVLAVLQADKFGVSIGRMLRGQAEEVRIAKRQKAQEQAQKAPVKMLIPMVFCIFPSIFIVILGPAALNLIENFSKT